MDRDFCPRCSAGASIPKCAITCIPNNAYFEDMLDEKELQNQECFTCSKNAQEVTSGGIKITKKCNECGLCILACPYSHNIKLNELLNASLENTVLSDPGKACILFKCLFPECEVASEVQVQGNFRTKRIDLVIKQEGRVFLLKLLKNTDKASFYNRSYEEVILKYSGDYPGIQFDSLCLVPSSKLGTKTQDNVVMVDINEIYRIIGGK